MTARQCYNEVPVYQQYKRFRLLYIELIEKKTRENKMIDDLYKHVLGGKAGMRLCQVARMG